MCLLHIIVRPMVLSTHRCACMLLMKTSGTSERHSMQMLLLSIHLPEPACAPGPHVASEDKFCSSACLAQPTPVPAPWRLPHNVPPHKLMGTSAGHLGPGSGFRVQGSGFRVQGDGRLGRTYCGRRLGWPPPTPATCPGAAGWPGSGQTAGPHAPGAGPAAAG